MNGLIESTERAPGLPKPPTPSDTNSVVAQAVAETFDDGAMRIIRNYATSENPQALRDYVQFLARWVAIETYWAGLRVGMRK